MTAAAERAALLRDLDAFERKLRTLISMIEGPVTDLDGLARATEALSNQAFDARTFVARFEGADAGQIADAKRRLARLVDLDAVARAACQTELGKTAAAMDRVQHVRVQLDTLRSVENAGETLDYTS
jgi:predicted nucleotidyltransferase